MYVRYFYFLYLQTYNFMFVYMLAQKYMRMASTWINTLKKMICHKWDAIVMHFESIELLSSKWYKFIQFFYKYSFDEIKCITLQTFTCFTVTKYYWPLLIFIQNLFLKIYFLLWKHETSNEHMFMLGLCWFNELWYLK